MVRFPARLRTVTAVVAALWLLAGAASCFLVCPERSASNPAHAVLTSRDGEFAVHADHARVECGQSPACPQALATTLLPRSATALVALWTAVAMATVAGSLARWVAPTRRGPPGGLPLVLTGQDLLTRFCLARR